MYTLDRLCCLFLIKKVVCIILMQRLGLPHFKKKSSPHHPEEDTTIPTRTGTLPPVIGRGPHTSKPLPDTRWSSGVADEGGETLDLFLDRLLSLSLTHTHINVPVQSAVQS
jgi:hypothetical protein